MENFCAKDIDDVRHGIAETNQRWQNALSRDGKDVWENWINGDFSISLKFDRLVGHGKGSALRERAIGKGNFTAPGSYFEIGNSPHDNRGDQEVVLVELIEFGEGPENIVTASIPVRLNFIENQTLNLWEGDLYRRLSDSVFEVLPRFVERKVGIGIFLPGGSAVHRCPDVVQATPKIVERIAKNNGNLERFMAEASKIHDIPTIRIAKHDKGFVISSPESIYDGLELLDVAFGPFVL